MGPSELGRPVDGLEVRTAGGAAGCRAAETLPVEVGVKKRFAFAGLGLVVAVLTQTR